MDLGNNGLDYLINFAELHVEKLSPEEIGMRNEKIMIEARLAEARHNRDTLSKRSDDGKERSLLQWKINYRTKQIKSGKLDSKQMEKAVREWAEMKAQFNKLDAVNKVHIEDVENLATKLQWLLKCTDQFRTDRKSKASSFYSKINKILQAYNIYR